MPRMKKSSSDVATGDAGGSPPASSPVAEDKFFSSLESKVPGARISILTKTSTVVTEPRFLSTQHFGLDAILGGGIPAGRAVELYSTSEGSGKSTLSAHIIAECQRTGGIAVLIDTEHGNTAARLASLGVDLDRLIYATPPYVEEVYKLIAGVLDQAQQDGFADRLLIVWDSIAGTQTKAQYDADYDDPVPMASLARSLSTHLPKLLDVITQLETYMVMINQSRDKIGVMFGETHTTPGGKAAKFGSAIRLQMDVKSKLKNSSGVIDGLVVKAHTKKNRITAPFQATDIHLLFSTGIDELRSLYELLIKLGCITQKGAWNSIDGVEKSFQYKDFADVLKDLPEEIVSRMGDALIECGVTKTAINRLFPTY